MRVLHRALIGRRLIDPVAFWSLPPGQAWWILQDACPELFDERGAVREATRARLKRLYAEAKRKEQEANGEGRR